MAFSEQPDGNVDLQRCTHLLEMVRQVRGGTLELLRSAPEAWLTWAPKGTSNHLLWHAGHALWLLDVLGIAPLTGHSELPPGWAETFGMNCRPVKSTTDWPAREVVQQRLTAQRKRALQLIEEHVARLRVVGPDRGGRDLTRGIVHALHDEARHQGEMYLLLKLRRAESQRRQS